MTVNYYQSGRYCFLYDSITDMGAVRENNEDALIQAPDIGLAGVCDGLGGHAAGEVASSIASETIVQMLGEGSAPPEEALLRGIATANARILDEQAANPAQRGMGTTLSALWFVPDDSGEVWVAHIGDSRIYRLRDGELAQITEDHSPVFRLHKQGILTKDQIQEHPQKNLLDRSLGILATTNPDIFQVDAQVGDIFLVCSDGLSDLLKDRDIAAFLSQVPLEEVGVELVEEAIARGGFDNITVALIQIQEIV